MGIRKDIQAIKDSIEKINSSISNDVPNKLRKLEELEKNLANVSLKIKTITENYEDDGTKSLKVEYVVEPIKLVFDGDGNMFYNNKFYSINKLDLISFEDMAKVQKAIGKIAKENKK